MTPEEHADTHWNELPFKYDEYEGRTKHLYDYDPDLFQEDWREKKIENSGDMILKRWSE